MYYCEFPGCEYCTSLKSQINYHHIKPIELGGVDLLYNRIYLCPTHHTKVFVPEAKNGIHSIKGDDSIIIIGWLQSTDGIVLEYIDSFGSIQYQNKKN